MDKQIKELEIALRKAVRKYDDAWKEHFRTKGKIPEPELRFYARCLHEEGYRRQDEVAREIFAELKTVMMDEYRYPIIAELKQKYGVEDNYREEEKSADD